MPFWQKTCRDFLLIKPTTPEKNNKLKYAGYLITLQAHSANHLALSDQF